MFIRLIFFSMAIALVATASPLSWQTFSNGKISWICSSNDIYVFSADSRTIYPLVLDQTRTVGNISDIVQYEQTLLISTEAGVYQIDMSTQSIERISFPNEKNKAGKIAADIDYLWVASDDTLYKYDKMGGEWQSYSLPEKSMLKSTLCDGTTVKCIGKNAVYEFTISTEKWNKYSSSIVLNDSTSIFPVTNSCVAVYGNRIFSFKENTNLWEQTSTELPIDDITIEKDNFYFSSGNRLLNLKSGVVRPVDIPNSGDIFAIGKSDFFVFLAMKNRIMKYNLQKNDFSFIEYPTGINELPEKIIYNHYLIAIYKSSFYIYDENSKTWSTSNKQQKKSTTKVSWGELGPMIQYKPGFFTSIKGSIESKTSLVSGDYEYDTTFTKILIKDSNGKYMYDSNNIAISRKDTIIDSTLLIKWKKPDFKADVNIRTTDPDGRTLDLTFDNSNPLIPAKKSITYKGAKSDLLNTLKGGTCETDILQSQLYTPVQYEGGQLLIESKSKLKDKDRKIAKLGAGGGFITTRSRWKVLKYESDGNYYIGPDTTNAKIDSSIDSALLDTLNNKKKRVKDTTQIVPSSLKVWVDGILLDEKYFTFYASTATLVIDSKAPVDPISLISISYKEQPIPEGGNDQIEFKPTYHFGKVYYGTTTFSPLTWLSARVSTEAIDKDTLEAVINTAIPLEFRKDNSNLMLKFTPEFSFNTENKSTAGAIDIQSKIGKQLGFTFTGLYAEKDFTTADTFTRGYGKTKSEYTANISYDILPEVPLKYSQHRYQASAGTETNYSVQAGVHFQKFPFLDVNLSRTILEDNNEDTNNLFDSLFYLKDRVSFKLSELSSPYLEHLLKSQKITYEITHAEYQYKKNEDDNFQNGRKTDAKITILPIQPITIIGSTVYRHGDLGDSISSTITPSLEFLTFDAPLGIDFHGKYSADIAKFSTIDSATDKIQREIGLTLKPGRWYNKLGWFSLNGRLNESVYCEFNTIDPSFYDLVSGLDHATNSTITKEAGLNIFLNETIFLINKNSWTNKDSSEGFLTVNDLQIIFNSKNEWRNRLDYSTDYEYFTISGSSKYDYKLASWFRISPEIKANYACDSSGNKTSAGPQLGTIISFSKWSIIKNFINSQSLSLKWNRLNGKTDNNPDLEYSFVLDINLIPNVVISNQENITLNRGNFDKFTGNLICTIIF